MLNRYKNTYRALIKLGAPVLVTQAGVIVVSWVDTIMLGAYGTKELAASAFVNNLFLVPFVMLIGFAGGVTPLVGALFGRGDNDATGRTFRVSLQLNAILGLAFSVVMAILYFFLDKMGQEEELLPLIRTYYLIVLAGLLPMSLFNCCQQMANGVTDTSMPMWLILGSNLLNIAGNYALIFGHWNMPEMGLTGAGISTLVSRTAAMIAILLIIFHAKRYRPYADGRKDKSPASELRRKVWRTSYPVMIQSGVECLLWAFGAVVCGWYGKIQIAAYQIVNIVSQIGFMTYISFGVATSIRVANCAGVDDMHGVRLTASAGLHINLFLGTLASLGFIFFFPQIIHIFTEDPAVRLSAKGLMIPLILYQYCDAVQCTFANAQRGTSVVKPLLWISLLSSGAVGIPFLLFMAETLNLQNVGVYYSFIGTLLCAASLLWWTFRSTINREEQRILGHVKRL